MIVKKSCGRVFGANLTAAESKALDIEIAKSLSEGLERHRREIEAMVLWELHEQLGFGPKKLWEFYAEFDKKLDELVERYELDGCSGDDAWVCQYKLKDKYGIDLEEWERKAKEGK